MTEEVDSYSKQLNHYLSVLEAPYIWHFRGIPKSKNYEESPMIDFEEEFIINSNGFRGKNFSKNTDLVFAGCSQTYGYALREDSIWGVMLAKENNMSYANISIPGASPMHIVFNIFKYFEEYGHPKIILAMFPDFYRIRTFLDSKILDRGTMNKAPKVQQNVFIDSNGNHGKDFLKYVKLPTTSNNIYSQEFTYMINSMFITLLENYCNKNNITFVWAKAFNDEKYAKEEDSFLSFKNYYDFNLKQEVMTGANYNLSEYREYTCHENNESIDPTWNLARDNAHFGTHINIHIKDFFQKILKERNKW